MSNLKINNDHYWSRSFLVLALSLGFLTLISTLVGCGNSNPGAKDVTPSGGQAVTQPGAAKSQCFDTLNPPDTGTLGSFQMVDGEEGTYEIVALQSVQQLVNSYGVGEIGYYSDGKNAQLSNPGSSPTAAITCTEAGDNYAKGWFETSVSMPLSIQRHNGKLGQFLSIEGQHSGSHVMGSDRVVGKLTPPPVSTLVELLNAASPSDQITLFQLSGNRRMIYVDSLFRNDKGEVTRTKIAATYGFKKKSERSPGSVAPDGTAMPSSGAVRANDAVSRPRAFVPNPHLHGITLNTRCGTHGLNITVDGKDAFLLPSEHDRDYDLHVLIEEGICATPNRLGIDGMYITLDGVRAFFFSNTLDRLVELARLFDAGAGSLNPNFYRCNVSGPNIFFDGHSVFTSTSDMQRAEQLIQMMENGACSVS